MMDWKKRKEELKTEYPYKIELHAHTSPASGCSDVTPKEMVEIYKGLGFDAVNLTNHFIFSEKRSKEKYIADYLNDYYETRRYGDELGIKVYLSAEIRFSENSNDYLVFGVNETMLGEIYDRLQGGVVAFREQYPMPNSAFVQAHPERNNMQRVSPELLDGIEVFNLHPNHNSRIGIAALRAKREKMPFITAGSDFHHKLRDHEGLAAVRAGVLPEDSFGLAKLLFSGDYLFEIAGSSLVLP